MKKLCLLCCALLLSGCGWMNFWESDSGEEVEPAKLVKFDDEIRVRKLWSTGVGSGLDDIYRTLQPALSLNGVVYGADNDGRVSAVNATSGKSVWKVDLDKTLTGGVGVGGGLVMVGDVDGRVFALEADSGAVRWKKKVGSEILAAPASNGKTVVVQTLDAKLIGLDAQTGEQAWQFSTDIPNLTLRGGSSPLITDTMVIAGFANGKVYALNAENGAQLWENRLAVPQGRTELERMVDVEGSPIMNGDVIYATSYQGRVGAMSRGTGRGLWYQDVSSYKSPGYGAEQVFVTRDNDEVKALRATSGQVLWTNNELTYRQLTAPVGIRNLVAVGDAEGYLHLLSAIDGHMVGRVKVDGSGITAPMTTDGTTLYVFDNDGDINAYQFEAR